MVNKDYLIYLLVEDIKHLTKEIVALRYALIDKYPDLKYDLVSDLTPYVKSSNDYYKLIVASQYDLFEDDKEYLEELEKIIIFHLHSHSFFDTLYCYALEVKHEHKFIN